MSNIDEQTNKAQKTYREAIEDYYKTKEKFDELITMADKSNEQGKVGTGQIDPLTDSSTGQQSGQSGEVKDGKASIQHHQANPGPVIAENIGQPASKEELKARAEELNK